VEALMHVFHLGGRAPWEIVAARKTLDEISETPDAGIRKQLLDYAFELVELPTEDSAMPLVSGGV
jgi:hypothetical protein